MTHQDQPAYLIAMLQSSDFEKLVQDYGRPVSSTIVEAGGEVLAATPAATVMEGNYSPTWTAIVRFPSMNAIETWYQSECYQPFIPIRQSLSAPDHTILVPAPSFAGLPK